MLSRSPLTAIFVILALGSLRADPNVYVANTAEDVVSVVDAATNTSVTVIPVGDAPASVAVAPGGDF